MRTACLNGASPACQSRARYERLDLVQFAPEDDIAELQIETLVRRGRRRRIVGLKRIVAQFPSAPETFAASLRDIGGELFHHLALVGGAQALALQFHGVERSGELLLRG